MRAKTEAFEREAMREAIRATSEIRRDMTPAPNNEEERKTHRYIDEAHRRADQIINRHRYSSYILLFKVDLIAVSGVKCGKYLTRHLAVSAT